MRKVFYQDWLYNRKVFVILLACAPLYFIYMTWSISGAKALTFITALLTGFVSFTLFLREDKFKAQALTCSLPVTRPQIVRTRFATMWLVILVLYAVMLVVAALSPFSRVGIPELLTLELILLFLCIVTLVIAIMFPFSIYFGTMGFIIVLVGLQFLGIALQALALSLGWGRNMMAVPHAIQAQLGDLRAWGGAAIYFLILLAAVAAFNYLSLLLSVRLFKSKQI